MKICGTVLISGLLALVAALATSATASAAEVVQLADFESGTGRLSGTITVDATSPKEGQGCGKIENVDQKWVIAKAETPGLEYDLAKIFFWVRSGGPSSIAVRLKDATGQNFQQRLPLKTDGEWQEIAITDFAKGQSWGGAEDKKWHGPCASVEFILEQPGALWLDNVRLELKEEILPEFKARRELLQKSKDYGIADFEDGPQGFGGEITIGSDAPQAGKGYLRLQNADKKWVSSGKSFKDLKNDFLQLSFWVRSKDAANLAVRLKDSTGQDFQQRLPIINDGNWHEVVITEFARGQSWGGANDKKWHGPATGITFILEQTGTVDIDSVNAKLNPAETVADLGWVPQEMGNVFFDPARAGVLVETTGDEITYTITDFNRAERAAGSLKVEKSRAHIPHPGGNGYFLVKVSASRGGAPLKEEYTSYAVIPPYTVKTPAEAPWGVMTHFAQNMSPEILPLMKRLGIVSIRDEHYWDQVEKKRGEYSFPAYSAPYMQAAKDNGIDPLVALTFANKLYDEGLTPHSEEACDAFGKYGQAVIDKFGNQIRWLEVWNEYNGTWCKGPAAQDRSKSYAKLLKHAYIRIKEKNPEVKVLGCATVLIPLPYIEGIFKHGGMDYMDAIVIHPYRGSPEGVDREVEELRELIRKYNNGQDKEIWVTETGRMDKSEYDWESGKKMFELGRHNVAEYLPLQYVLLLKSGCAKIYWYLVRDHHEFVSMGLLRNDDEASGMGRYAVAPAAVSYATLIRMLDGKVYAGREGFREYTRAHCYLFSDTHDEQVRVVWSTAPAMFDFLSAVPLRVTDIMGVERTIQPQNGRVRLELGTAVQYVHGKVDAVEEVDTGVRYLASAVDDYSKTQGVNNWHYGFRRGLTGGFETMEQVETMWGVDWASPEVRYLKQSQGGGHPAGSESAPVFVDRRWKSPFTGKAKITGTVRASDNRGDGIEFVILQNGKELHRAHVKKIAEHSAHEFDVPMDLAEGDQIDLLFGPGKSMNYDAFSFDVNITTQKEPGK